MRITRRTSGGRGEYEISEPSREGVTPNDLLNRRIRLQLGYGWVIDAGITLTTQGGKRRLRLLEGGIHVHRQLAAALMLPVPVRADEALGSGEPVIQQGRYAVEHILIEHADISIAGAALLLVQRLIVRNGSVEAAEIDLTKRGPLLEEVWNKAGEFPGEITSLLRQHRDLVRGGGPVPGTAEQVVRAIEETVSDRSSDLGIVYSAQTDVLPALVESLHLEVAEPKITVAEIDPEELELRQRTVKEWKRWANARGPKSARFRQRVRDAYRCTCLICGYRFPPARGVRAGVDAAHILPWNEYDLDEVYNGICLCRFHHWAFDEGIILIEHDKRGYSANLNESIASRLLEADAQFSVDAIRRDMGLIPEVRLPREVSERPRPDLLYRLNESQRGVD